MIACFAPGLSTTSFGGRRRLLVVVVMRTARNRSRSHEWEGRYSPSQDAEKGPKLPNAVSTLLANLADPHGRLAHKAARLKRKRG
jgi:hypothetical protein